VSCDWLALLHVESASDPAEALDTLTVCATDPQLWIWGIVATVVCTAVGALIGKYKNAVMRDAVLGAALGPIGWIISAFLPANKPAPKCRACGRNVDKNDAHCRHCGAALRP
jgi:hypothetical protein